MVQILATFHIISVESLFERLDITIPMRGNDYIPVESLPYRRGASTRVMFTAAPGFYIYATCNIDYAVVSCTYKSKIDMKLMKFE